MLFGKWLFASGAYKEVKCPNCKKSGMTEKEAKSVTCPHCKTNIKYE